MSPDGVLDVLIVGCGNIAGGFDAERSPSEPALTHAGAFSRDPAFRLAACIEPDPARRAAFMQRWRVPRGFASIQEAVRQGLSFDVVSVCSPTRSHAADIRAALSLNPKLIFCEKPVTPAAEETSKCVAACAAAGVLMAVNHTRRWAPDVLRLRDELAGGVWGLLRSISGTYNKGVLNNGGHLVDLVHWLAGPMEVLAAGPAVSDFWPDDPTIPALLQTAGGVPVHFATAHAADYAVFELQVVTARGVLVMENGGMQWQVRRSVPNPHFSGYRALSAPERVEGEYPFAMQRAVANLRDALAHGTTLASSGQTALEAQLVCESVRALSLRGFP